MTTTPIRFALLGCGTVGSGVVELVARNRAYLETRVGAPLELARVIVRDPDKVRTSALDRALLGTDPAQVLAASDISVVVEVAGGLEPAGSWVEAALRAGKSVVTANKSLLAARGPELLRLAAAHHADLGFEASVGGALPIVRTLREHLVADWVRSLRGIVNGTCNYILTRMRDEGASFAEVLRAAQELGYAEAEPSLDVDGHDAAHKLCVLAMLAFGADVRPADVPTEGIRAIEPVDLRYAARFGYAIKHLAVARETRSGTLDLRVHPALVPARAPLASVDGVLNGVALEADAAGAQVLVGPGAGAHPTAASVVADLVDAARARRAGVSGLLTQGLDPTRRPIAEPGLQESPWYLRLRVTDRPGVLARIAGALGGHEVSIEQLIQEPRPGRRADDRGDDEARVIVFLTHDAVERHVRGALREIDAMPFVHGAAMAIRVEA